MAAASAAAAAAWPNDDDDSRTTDSATSVKSIHSRDEVFSRECRVQLYGYVKIHTGRVRQNSHLYPYLCLAGTGNPYSSIAWSATWTQRLVCGRTFVLSEYRHLNYTNDYIDDTIT